MENLDPNKGFGEPGSLRFHTLTILSCETVENVLDYVYQVTGKRLNILNLVQKIAIKYITEIKKNDKG